MRAEVVTRINRKTGKQDGIRWKFWEYDPTLKRNRAVPQEQIPKHIRDCQIMEVVQDYVKSRNALIDSKKYRAEKRLAWKSMYSDFDDLLAKFVSYHKLKAPNSWDTDRHYLQSYVFHFFLDVKNSNNLYDWKFFYLDFKTWLRDTKPIKVKKEKLSKSTQNSCIKALNLFLKWAFTANVLDELQPKCESYTKDELPRIQAEDLFEKDEQEKIIQKLSENRPVSANMFRFLMNSGCRISEALGICIPFVVKGRIDAGTDNSSKIQRALERYGLGSYYGYIVLMNQVEMDSVRTNDKFISPVTNRAWLLNQVPRKPLKHRKADRPEDWRYIPIYDKETWKMICTLWNQQLDLQEKNVLGSDRHDYLLFEGLTASMFYSDLNKALDELKLRQRSPHKCRHTFLSWFYGETDGDPMLSAKVGGHRDGKSRDIYSHIAQKIAHEQKLKTQTQKRMVMID